MQRLMAIHLRLTAQLLLRPIPVLLDQHLVSHVEDHPVQPQVLAAIAEDRTTPLAHPARAAIGVNHSVLERVGRASLQGPVDLFDHVRSVVRMDDRAVPADGVADEVGRVIAADRRDVLAHELNRPVRVACAPVHGTRDVGHNGRELLPERRQRRPIPPGRRRDLSHRAQPRGSGVCGVGPSLLRNG